MSDSKNNKKIGFAEILTCMLMWGFMPLYWQAMIPISSGVIVLYRIVVTCILALVIALITQGKDAVLDPIRSRRDRLNMFINGVLITLNWSVFIWAINGGYIIQTCIGYYIEPLVVSLVGVLFFKEQLDGFKIAALGFAAAGIIVILVHFKELPWIALVLAFSFAAYSGLKKKYSNNPISSLFYETMYLAPLCLIGVVILEIKGIGGLCVGSTYKYVLMLGTGLMTVIPLGLFGGAANRLPLVTIGILAYLSPSISLVVGIFILHSPFDMMQLVAFIIIWVGIVIFTIGEFRGRKGKDTQ